MRQHNAGTTAGMVFRWSVIVTFAWGVGLYGLSMFVWTVIGLMAVCALGCMPARSSVRTADPL